MVEWKYTLPSNPNLHQTNCHNYSPDDTFRLDYAQQGARQVRRTPVRVLGMPSSARQFGDQNPMREKYIFNWKVKLKVAINSILLHFLPYLFENII